ncbi:MAG: nickel pincer cofactor biosynthesis protein LarB [Kiritimatiellae bacterium]|nr:nickel pincer cofactor biosynthesis protein LarB [Kiritimatiellia bacterium]MDW8458528.1 nickel pincer cofactor biosynthesis protein LarB [Verrucomicrobiota bacterium]
MLQEEILEILRQVADGRASPDQAAQWLTAPAEQNREYARVDLDRVRRTDMPEVVFCPGKTPEQIVEIMSSLAAAGQRVLATRATPEVAAAVRERLPEVVYHTVARALTFEREPRPQGVGAVGVVSAGTADLPVAEEAALTAEWLGARVTRIFDVGVAGLHRLVNRLPLLRAQRALVVVAGMEGALPSVVGGLVACPIIAVPTSVGYGANFGGLAALLAMLNSCAPGVTVVNVDNGFGAGVAAARINRLGEPR